jgi:dipeptidyl aminopeptidase/acylaminoacyl peptidase
MRTTFIGSWLPALALTAVLLAGCGGDDAPETEEWGWAQTLDFGRMPRWSPGDSLILFGDDTPGRSGLWIWDLEHSPTQLAADLPPHNWDYHWSPDGRSVAFSSPAAEDDSLSGIWVVNRLSGAKTRVWNRGRDVSWGDNGGELYFRLENPSIGEPGVYALTVGDTVARFIALHGIRPAACPTESMVAFADAEVDGRLFTARDGALSEALSNYGIAQWVWSGDGMYLTYIVNRYTSGILKGTLWRLNVTSPSRPDSLTSFAANPSPNGDCSAVAFERSSGGTWVGIWIHRRGEGDLQVVPYGHNPAIDRSGRRIAANISGGGVRILSRIK